MNLSCNIFKHDWEYKIQTDLWTPPSVINSNTMFGTGYYGGEVDSNGNPIPFEIKKEVRICKKCKRKEQKSTGFDRHSFKNTSKWIDDKLTIQEERDQKLEKLLS